MPAMKSRHKTEFPMAFVKYSLQCFRGYNTTKGKFKENESLLI